MLCHPAAALPTILHFAKRITVNIIMFAPECKPSSTIAWNNYTKLSKKLTRLPELYIARLYFTRLYFTWLYISKADILKPYIANPYILSGAEKPSTSMHCARTRSVRLKSAIQASFLAVSFSVRILVE